MPRDARAVDLLFSRGPDHRDPPPLCQRTSKMNMLMNVLTNMLTNVLKMRAG
jgi:hypothetical protein